MLAMSSTGTIIAAVKPEAKPNVTEALEKLGLRTFWIGQLMEKERILSKGKKTLTFPSKVDDPYKTILSVDS